MPTISVVIVNFVEGRWIFHAEGPVGVLTVQTFLVAVDHCFPIEVAGVFNAAAVGQTAEIVFVEEREEGRGEPF